MVHHEGVIVVFEKVCVSGDKLAISVYARIEEDVAGLKCIDCGGVHPLSNLCLFPTVDRASALRLHRNT